MEVPTSFTALRAQKMAGGKQIWISLPPDFLEAAGPDLIAVFLSFTKKALVCINTHMGTLLATESPAYDYLPK